MRIKLTERNMLIGLIAIMSVFLCLRAVNTIFLYPLLLVVGLVVVFASLKVCLPVLCFLLPFANIIKILPGQISLFTVFFLVYVVRIIFKTGKLDRRFLLGMFLFAGYCLVFSGLGDLITISTMICGFAMVHDVCSDNKYNYDEALYAFCFGIIISSILGLLKDNLPIIESFVEIEFQKVDTETYVERFLGLNSNPNYYTMDISIALGCLVANMCSNRPKNIQILLFAVLSIFGLMSVSKSFLLIWAVLLIILLLFGLRRGGTAFFKMLLLFTVTGVVVFYFARESIDTYIYRLTQDQGSDLADVTTGRSDIWIEYLKSIFSRVKMLLFGAGIGEILFKAPHNTYIEALYYVGLVGVGLYLWALKSVITIKRFPKYFLYYIPLIILLIRLLGIGMFVHDSLWYYYVLILLLLKEGVATRSQVQIKNINGDLN